MLTFSVFHCICGIPHLSCIDILVFRFMWEVPLSTCCYLLSLMLWGVYLYIVFFQNCWFSCRILVWMCHIHTTRWLWFSFAIENALGLVPALDCWLPFCCMLLACTRYMGFLVLLAFLLIDCYPFSIIPWTDLLFSAFYYLLRKGISTVYFL